MLKSQDRKILISVSVLIMMFRGLVMVLIMFCSSVCIGERLMFCVSVGFVSIIKVIVMIVVMEGDFINLFFLVVYKWFVYGLYGSGF